MQMSTIPKFLSWSAAFIMLGSAAGGAAGPTTQRSAVSNCTSDLRQALEQARGSHDLSALERVNTRVQKELWAEDPRNFFLICTRIAESARSDDYGGGRQYDFASEVASDALRKGGSELDLATKAELIPLSQPDLFGENGMKRRLTSDEWHSFQRSEAARWLSLSRELEQAADALPDPSDTANWPESSTPAPPDLGLVLVPGTPSSQISNPTARAEYEAAIAANSEKARRMQMSSRIRRIQANFKGQLENYMADLFSVPGSNVATLSQLMAENRLPAAECETILAKIKMATNPG